MLSFFIYLHPDCNATERLLEFSPPLIDLFPSDAFELSVKHPGISAAFAGAPTCALSARGDWEEGTPVRDTL